MKYNILSEVLVTVEASNKKEAIQKAKDALGMLDVQSAKVIEDKRTIVQNASLHLLFSELSEEMTDKGIEMRDIVREDIPIEATPENLKWLWKKLQNALFKTTSTTELKKTGQIEKVYDNFNKILIERTNGEIRLPDWPCLEVQAKNEKSIEYPQDYNDPKF